MLRVRTTKALISDVPRIVSNNVDACHAYVIECSYDVGNDRCALAYLRNYIFMQNMFSGRLSRRNLPIAKISLKAKFL
jgi:hypothetical protein